MRALYKHGNKIPVGSSFIFVNNGLVNVSEADLWSKFVVLETPFSFKEFAIGDHEKEVDINLEKNLNLQD